MAEVTNTRLWLMAGFAALYATVRFTEAYGLWHGRRWAEWFAALSGAVYVPVELYELLARVTLAKDKPFNKNLAFAADLRYEVENKNFTGKRPDETVLLSGVSYKVVAIGKDEAVVSAPNQVRTVVKLTGTP